ncbi:hypothetical protein M758_3G055700 [Ceratodon purpureus]|uniref:Uncharacterized protein n=1 Tax=Ceratodon purpureus TaxID=3225 RepID=A0A8T0IHW1_CERPU|nr:hypothetical protein KC19_3G056600 [Ceratodon purpureus]KAG0621870.1 hypothetical protein M758_3G054400 [Ceratodon purpureus]KAG0621878.1 hypothetical protein M758_3G055200 [Ceratodon purpureus]KAG0621883.1 hypothetical protein M758_3G055700 [Ceratodon purpureus]
MAVKFSSGGSASAMRATLVLMLLLGAVVAAHGRPVSCENKCEKAIEVNGVSVAAHATVEVEVLGLVEINVVDVTGAVLVGSYSCPADVTALVLVYEEGCVKVKVGAVGIISKLLHTLVGLVLGFIRCVL